MKHLKIEKILAGVLGAALVIGGSLDGTKSLLKVSAGTEEIAVYEMPEDNSQLVEYITMDTNAKIIDTVETEDHGLWYKIIWGHDDIGFEGYAPAENLVHLLDYSTNLMLIGDDGFGLGAFPEDYQELLAPLQQAHPNWIFVPYYVEPTWDTVVAAEMAQQSNYVHITEVFSMKHISAYNWATDTWNGSSGPNWILASQPALEYFLEPRNFINEANIFLFESALYNEAVHTVGLVEEILKDTFMAGKYVDGSGEMVKREDLLTEEEPSGEVAEENSSTVTENDRSSTATEGELRETSSSTVAEDATEWVEINKLTYAEAFVKIGKEYGVSPVMLASRCRQEQGVNGTSELISGTVQGHEGYYNYFNIQAYGGTDAEIIQRGLNWAKTQGWDTPYKSLKGGSLSIASNYILANQDTLYMQKFDVDAEYKGLYWHQYMGALASPSAEGRTVKRSYIDLGVLESSFVFKIPVYTNRPAELPVEPTDNKNPNNYLASIVLDNGKYPLNFNYETCTYSVEVPYECDKLTVGAAIVSSKANVQGLGQHSLKVGKNEIVLTVTSETGETKDYTLSVSRMEKLGNGPEIQEPDNLPMEEPSAAVSGSIVSWDNESNAVVKLYDSSVSDEEIQIDMKSGTPTLSLDKTAALGTIEPRDKQFARSFVFDKVNPGTYKLAVYKPGRYIMDIITITVENSNVDIGDVEMWLYGDVNYDGTVDILDVTQVTRYINLKTSIFDSGNEETKKKRLQAANVVGDEETIDILDVTQCIRYINLKTSVFDTMN